MDKPKTSLLILPSEDYIKEVNEVAKQASHAYDKILFVSLNRLYDDIISAFNENSIDIKKFHFVDAITKAVRASAPEKQNCVFVTSPTALIELSLAITKKMESIKPDFIIFDSISTLFIYEKEPIVTQFMHSLIGKIKGTGCTAIFTTLGGDTKRNAIKELGMFVDEFLTASQYNLKNTRLIPSNEKKLRKEMNFFLKKNK